MSSSVAGYTLPLGDSNFDNSLKKNAEVSSGAFGGGSLVDPSAPRRYVKAAKRFARGTAESTSTKRQRLKRR